MYMKLMINISDLYTKEDILKDKKQPVIISELLINGLVPSLTVTPINKGQTLLTFSVVFDSILLNKDKIASTIL